MRLNKKAQEGGVGMSFGFLFSIILIIIFLVGAIWGIKYFISLNTCARVGLSIDDLKKEVQTAYQSSSYMRSISLDLPGVQKICFANLSAPLTGDLKVYEQIEIYEFENANTFLIPLQKACGLPYNNIKFLNISAITRIKNPYCIDADQEIQVIYDPSKYGRGVMLQ
jgi:hypothetical protein